MAGGKQSGGGEAGAGSREVGGSRKAVGKEGADEINFCSFNHLSHPDFFVKLFETLSLFFNGKLISRTNFRYKFKYTVDANLDNFKLEMHAYLITSSRPISRSEILPGSTHKHNNASV